MFAKSGELSPLLANIYLDALDTELEERGHVFCRYADDCNIYVGSQAAAERTRASIRDWIEKRLRLQVNTAQSRTSNPLRDAWQRYVRGWWGYYRLAEDRKPIFRLEGWIRRHIRKCFWLRWHNGRGRANALRRLGVHPRLLQTVHTGRGAWFMAKNSTVNAGLKTCVLRRYGFLMPSDLAAITSR